MKREKDRQLYHIHIGAKNHLFAVNLKEVWQYRDLILLFTKRNFSLVYKQTILGPIWIFLNPFLTSIIYTFVFSGIAGMSTDGIPQILFYLCSNAVWTFFAGSVAKNANTFTANASVFGKVYFPRLTIPISNVLSSVIQLAVQMLLVLMVMGYYLIRGQVSPKWYAWVCIPVVIVHLGIMGLGVGIMISSLTTKYRDLAILVTFGMQLWMYATPVIYPISEVHHGILKRILMWNPVTVPIEVFRYAVLGVGHVEWKYSILSWLLTILTAVTGIVIFNQVEKNFMDTV